ncbi:bifunctional transaldolase/phosoglucose isomerase, partial [mine drainage metagenome]
DLPPGPHFVAITDPGTPLERLARARAFRAIIPGAPDVGGRYSALTAFGLVPAALLGLDLGRLVDRAERMVRACGPERDPADHPGLRLGAFLGELGRAGRDKIVFWAPPRLSTFPDWAEQLLAESTGKRGAGLVPVAGERRPRDPPRTPDDRVWVDVGLAGSPPAFPDGAGTPPHVRIGLDDPYDLGAEFFRWEFAVAMAGAVLGIDPFDQPDVELAKELARRRMGSPGAADPGRSPPVTPLEAAPAAIAAWAQTVRTGDYLAIQAYLDPAPAIETALEGLRTALRERLRISTTLGFGPRFLHSTGQLHKGGPPSGLFLQLLDTPRSDVTVPGAPYSFGTVVRAQADGDADALRERGRRLLRLHLGDDAAEGLRRLAEGVRA